VDDDPDQVEIRRLIMEGSGHVVTTANSAAEALTSFINEPPDVVVMDLRLPRTEDGLELIRELRSRSSSVPILVLSGWPEDLRRRPEHQLVSHSLRKPVRSGRLLSLIDEVA
jgi:two-component system response regulator ChvI